MACAEVFWLLLGDPSAVVVVRLLRIEEGGAYADILSWDSTIDTTREMQYVQRTLGFSTAELEPRGRRLVRWHALEC